MTSLIDLVLTPQGIRFMGRTFPCSVGRGGLSDMKREGDGTTPSGTHLILGCLYRPDRVPKPNSWAEPILPGDLWSDATDQSDYNHPVRTPYDHSHETLRRSDPLYDIVLVINWNYPVATPGKGSAIFVHQWRKPLHPTEGCIAFRRDHLRWIASNISIGTKLIVPQRN